MSFKLNINIHNLDGESLKNARVIIRQLNFSSEEKIVAYNHAARCFIAEGLSLGNVRIMVQCDEYDAQERVHVIRGSRESESFVLGKVNSRYILIDSKKYPIRVFENEIASIGGRNRAADDLERTLLKAIAKQKLKKEDFNIGKVKMKSNTVVFIQPSKKEKGLQKGHMLAELRKEAPHSKVGPVISRTADKTRVLLNECIIRFKEETPEKDIQLILQNSGAVDWLEIKSSYPLYQLRFPDDLGLEMLDKVLELDALDPVHSVTSGIGETQPGIAAAVDPDVFHWPSQWDKHVMQVGEAWEDIRVNEGEDFKFGDTKTLVAVLDDGTQTAAGDARNPDLNAYTNNGVQATLHADIDPPTAILGVKSTSGFSVGHFLTIGGQAQIKIISIGANQLTTSAIFNDLRAGVEVVNQNSSSVKTFLTNNVARTQSTIETTISSGIFKVGQEISIDAFTSVHWEAVTIEAIDSGGTILTTSPVKRSHNTGVSIVQGKKLFRAVDFSEDTPTAAQLLNNNNPESEHGTAVTTIIASRAENQLGIAGTAPNVRVVAGLRGNGLDGETTFEWISGANAITQNGIVLDLLNNVGVINSSISWGSYTTAISSTVIEKFDSIIRNTRNRKGLPIVLAAGNDTRAVGNKWAGMSKIIAVAASYEQVYSTLTSYVEWRASYSNFSDIDNTPNVLITVCAPSRNFSNPSYPPLRLGLYAGALFNEGNLIDKSDDPTPAKLTENYIVPRTTLRVAINSATPQNYLQIDNATPANTFAANQWIKIGDVYNTEWVQVDHEDFTNPSDKKILLTGNTSTTHNPSSGVVPIGLIPAATYLKRSILANETVLQVNSIKGFEQDDWVLLGEGTGTVIKWVEIASVDDSVTPNTITIKNSSKHPDPQPYLGPLVDRELLAFSGSSGDSFIQINVEFSNSSDTVQPGYLVKITQSNGDKWYRVESVVAGTGWSGTATRINLSSNLSGDVAGSANVFIPAGAGSVVHGSSLIKLDSNVGFVPNKWIHIDTPGSIGQHHTPRVEASYVHSVSTTNTTDIRISGPYNYFVQGTEIHRSANVNFQNSMGGTSAAAPQVAGAAALMYAVNPQLTWMEIREILKETAVKIHDDNKGFPSPQPVGLGRWKNKAGQYIRQKDGDPSPGMFVPGVTDQTPYYSDWFGFGRIDVLAAVQAARNNKQNGPDLMIRNYMLVNSDGSTIEDDGVNETNLLNYTIDSPDIWVRQGYTANGDSESSALKRPELPPHQSVDFTGDNSIYVRVINRAPSATGKNSYPAWVRIYLCLTSGEFDLGFLKSFDDQKTKVDYTNGKSGIYYLGDETDVVNDPGGELKLYDRAANYVGNALALDETGGIKPQDSYKVVTKWKNTILPPEGTHKRTYIIAEVLPHDGQLSDTYVHRNNNVSYKRVLFSAIQIKETVGVTESDWPQFIEYEGADITKNFKITVKDWEYIIDKHIQIRLSRTSNYGIEETATLSNDGSGWSVDNAIAEFNFSLTPTTTPGSPDIFTFTGSITYRATDSMHKVEVIILEPAAAEQNHTSPVNPLVNRRIETYETQVISAPVLSNDASSGLSPATNPRIHVFADMDKIASQDPIADVDKRFAPNSIDPENKHHITTVFKGNTPGDTIKAYAVMTGRVFVQQDQTDSGKVNVFLKPIVQSGLGFTPVKYFVYRGINTTDFLQGPSSPDNLSVAPELNSSEFLQSLYTNVANRNASTDPVGNDTLSPKAFGWNPANQTDLNRAIDDFFFNPDGNNEFQIASQGMVLGTFKNNAASDSFGFEIILDDGLFIPTINYARATSFDLVVDGSTGIYNQRLKREEILSFIDPAAYFGMHEPAGIQSVAGLISPNDVYAQVVAKFVNKNRLYVDIRNENNYSYNYYRNRIISEDPLIDPLYEDKDQPSFGICTQSKGVFKYLGMDTHYWPYFHVPGGKIESGDYGIVYLRLKTGTENPKPVIYSWNGFIVTPKSNARFIDHDLLQVSGAETTSDIGLISPKISGSPVTDFTFVYKASVIKLTFSRKIPSGAMGTSLVPPTEKFHDNVFGPLETILRKRSISLVNPGSSMFVIEGDFTQSLSSGDIIKVSAAADAGNNQVYSINNAVLNGSHQTEITVNESFAGTTPPFGKVQFSDHLWMTSLPSKWYSGSNRTFIDTTTIPDDGTNPIFGFSYMANTGIALDNNRIVFFATPHHYLNRSDERTVNQLNLTGGVGASGSFWQETIRNTPTLKISSTSLKISSTDYIPVFEFEHTDINGGSPLNDNFLALGLTDAEFNQVKRAIYESTLHETHQLYFRLKNTASLVDLNNIAYERHELWIAGWHETNPMPQSVALHEISTVTTLNANPILVYSIAGNGLVFTSKEYADLEVIVEPGEPADEVLRVEQGAVNSLSSDPTMAGLVSNFQTVLSGIVDDNSAVQTLILNTSKDLFVQACSTSAPYDSRPLYWAQMNIRASLRDHAWFASQSKLLRRVIGEFELQSRGIKTIDFSNANPAFSTVNFGSAKKILVVGFDPTNLDAKIGGNVSNESMSGSIALSLHNEVIIDSGITGAIQSIILPMRYDDYTLKEYKNLFREYLKSGNPNAVHMIVVLGNNARANDLDVEWLAAKIRGTSPDNLGNTSSDTSGFGKYRFLPTKLPVTQMVDLGVMPRIYFDQTYKSNQSAQSHPADGGPNVNTIPTVTPDEVPEFGSGVPSVYNDVFYKLMALHKKLGSSTAAGMISVPKTGSTWSSVTAIKNAISDALKRSLGAI